jgi:type III pantothenate kinase
LRFSTSKDINQHKATINRFIKKNKPSSSPAYDVIISSVVPGLNNAFGKLSKEIFKNRAIFVSHKNSKLKMLYRKPGEVGADRIINTIAGYELFGGPLVVVDFGTAVTFDCIGKKGAYLGGVILAGPEISTKALHEFTAKLPLVRLKKPKHSIIGQSTEECIRSGLYNGYIGAIDNILNKLIDALGSTTKIISTGGSADIFTPEIKKIYKMIPDLTLRGLALFWQKYYKTHR